MTGGDSTFFLIVTMMNETKVELKFMRYLGQLLQQYKFLYFLITRGHARFARSPLVIRLGDSRNRWGNFGYRMVLSSGWH